MMLKFELLRPDGNLIWQATLDHQSLHFPFQLLENGHVAIPGTSSGQTISPPWIIKIETISEEEGS